MPYDRFSLKSYQKNDICKEKLDFFTKGRFFVKKSKKLLHYDEWSKLATKRVTLSY